MASGDVLSPASFFASTPAPGRAISLEPTGGLQLGGRVIVSGQIGTLRYLGTTDFAQGEWAGVELEQPSGKNDGSVLGKRYFACKPRYGLFAPASKVVRAPNQSASKLRVRHTKTSTLRQRSGSQESLSSISSFQSSASNRQKVRLGVAALKSPSTSFISSPVHGRHGSSQSGNGPSALQESLREKEQHIDQLLRERDMERAEIARASQQADQAEQRLAELKAEKERTESEMQARMAHLEGKLKQVERDRKDLSDFYDEEKKRAEDLQFQIEEESIFKSELETRIQELESLKASSSSSAEGSGEKERYSVEINLQEIQKQCDSYKRKTEELEKALVAARNVETSLRSSLLEAETKSDAFQKEVNQSAQQMEQRIAELEKDLEQTRADASQVIANESELQKKCQDQQKLCLRLENEVKDLMTKLETNDHQHFQLKEQYLKLEEEKCRLEELVAQRTGESGEHAHLLQAKRAEIKDLKQIQEDLQTKYDVVSETLTGKEEAWMKEKAVLTNDLESKRKELECISAEHKVRKGQNKDLEMSVGKLKEELASKEKLLLEREEKQKGEIEKYLQKITDLDHSLDSASKLLAEWEEKQKLWNKDKEELMEELRSSKEAQALAADSVAKQLTGDKDKLALQLQNVQASLAKVQSEKDTVSLEVDRLVQSSSEERRKLMENVTKLTAELEEKSKHLAELESLMEKREKDAVEWGSQKKGLEEDINNLNSELISLKEAQKLSTDNLGKQLAEEKEKLLTELNDVRKQNQALEAEKGVLSLETTKLKAKLSEVQKFQEGESSKNSAELETVRRELNEAMGRAETRSQEWTSKEATWKSEKEHLEKELSQKTTEAESTNKELHKVLDEIATIKTSADLVISEKRTVTEELEKLKGELEETKNRSADREKLLNCQIEEKSEEIVELKKTENTMRVEIDEMKKQRECLTVECETIRENLSSLKEANKVASDSAVNKLVEEKDQLVSQMVSLKNSLTVSEEDKDKLRSAKEELDQLMLTQNKQIEQLVEQQKETKSDFDKTEAEHKILEKEIEKLTEKFEAQKLEAATLTEKLNDELSGVRKELETVQVERDILVTEKAALQHSHNQIVDKLSSGSETELKQLSEQIESLKKERDSRLKEVEVELKEAKQLRDIEVVEKRHAVEELETLKAAVTKLQEVEASNIHLRQELLELKHNESVLTEDFACERNRLHVQLEKLKVALEDRDLRLEQMRNERGKSADSNISQVERLEQEKFELLEKITELEGKTQKEQNEKVSLDVNAENERKQQISFLNSVIVDLKKKNDELLMKIDVLNRTSLNTLNLNNGLPKVVAPRLYCDICEEFDLHETEDCPKQAGEMADNEHNTKYHGTRHAQRPYCDRCEEFGHTTETCDNETF